MRPTPIGRNTQAVFDEKIVQEIWTGKPSPWTCRAVRRYERCHGRKTAPMPVGSGRDFDSAGKGQYRMIEVKKTSSATWITFSTRQLQTIRKNKDRYWVYVVRKGTDHRVQISPVPAREILKQKVQYISYGGITKTNLARWEHDYDKENARK